MTQVGLQCTGVGALVGKLETAGMPQHVRYALKPSFAATPNRATILRHPAVAKGAPRSSLRLNEPGEVCPSLSEMRKLTSKPGG